jgi:short-subunit dehydrogenase
MSETVLILGATSGIARAICHKMAARGCRLILAGRKIDELERDAADLRTRYSVVADPVVFDALDFDGHPAFVQKCIDLVGGHLDGVVLCHGYLPDQATAQRDFAEARRTLDVNFTSAVSLLTPIANYFEQRRAGYIAAISSVGGDCGRMSNYAYGSAKAALSIWLQGLRNRLFHSGVHVLTIKPGFVETPMSKGVVSPNSPLMAKPDRVARDIDRAIVRRKNVLYTPWFWWGILTIICSIPEGLFKRLKL